MNTNKYEQREKEFLKLSKRLNELYAELRKLPLKKLKEPFQRGWEISYKLRDDVAHRKDANQILEKLSLVFPFSRKTNSVKEVRLIRRGAKGYYDIRNGKRVYISLGPPRKHLNQREYNKLDEAKKPWFIMEEVESEYYGGKRYRLYLPDHLLVLKVRPNMITHYYEKGGELEAEMDFVAQKLRSYWEETHGGSTSRYPSGKKRAETRAIIGKYLKGELEDVHVRSTKRDWD